MDNSLHELHPTAAAYFRSVNQHDSAAFLASFADDAVVHDAGHEWRGKDAIRGWGEREIFAPRVRFELISANCRDSESAVTTRVDGNFDRTGLPDPVIIEHRITLAGGKIVRMICRLLREQGELAGKRALITGGTRGIGRATAPRFNARVRGG